MADLRAVILDVDGTLIDSNEAHVSAWHQAFQDYGHPVTHSKLRSLVGMGGDNLVPAATGLAPDDPLVKTIGQRHTELFKQLYLPYLRPFTRVRELIERMRADGLKIAIATSSKREEADQLLKIAGVGGLTDQVITQDDAGRSKPAPDIVQKAVEKLGFAPAELVMLGDSPYDIQAAAKAGVGVIALRCGGFPDEALEGAVAIYDDPADLLAHYSTSPLSHRQTA